MKLVNRIFKRDDSYITSPYGERVNPVTGVEGFHYGCDYGTNVEKWKQYALEEGIVTKKGYNENGAGNYLYVEYPRLNITCLHYHLDEVYVNAGDKVSHDTILGTTGTTGQSTGIHLHLGLIVGNVSNYKYIDPETYDYVEGIDFNEHDLYTIQKGDTLSKIAKKYITNVDYLLEINPSIENKNKIYTGDIINVPKVEIDESIFKIGDKVNLKEYVNSKGVQLRNYDPYYIITEMNEDTCVLSAERNGVMYVWARVNNDNLIKE